MKTYNETVEAIIEKSANYKKEQRKKRKVFFSVAVACCCCVISFAYAVALLNNNRINNTSTVTESKTVTEATEYTKNQTESVAIPHANNVMEATEYTENQASVTTTQEENPTYGIEGETKISTETSIGGGQSTIGGICIPAVPSGDIETSGNAISDEDAKKYFADNTSVISAISTDGVQNGNYRISEKGYCHVSYNGTENEKLTVRLDYRDYLVFSGDELVAIITLFRDTSGEIFSTPSCGATWFEQYRDFLSQHKGEKLVFVYASNTELIITPDNEVFNPMGLQVNLYLEGIENPYEKFYNENAVYVP